MWDGWNTVNGVNSWVTWDGMHKAKGRIDWVLFDAWVALAKSKKRHRSHLHVRLYAGLGAQGPRPGARAGAISRSGTSSCVPSSPAPRRPASPGPSGSGTSRTPGRSRVRLLLAGFADHPGRDGRAALRHQAAGVAGIVGHLAGNARQRRRLDAELHGRTGRAGLGYPGRPPLWRRHQLRQRSQDLLRRFPQADRQA